MIAGYHGRRMDIETIRRHVPTLLKGITLRQLMEVASSFHLAPRALRLELEQLESLRLPAILHWNLDHFVVLVDITRRKAVIHDPAYGRRILSKKDISNYFTGVALELMPTRDFQKKNDLKKLRVSELLHPARGLTSSLLQIFILSFGLQILVLATPFYMQITVDHVILATDLGLLHAMALGFGFLMLLQVLTTAVRSWTVLYLNSTLDLQLVSNVLDHLLRLPTEFFEKRYLGDILSRFGSLRNVRELFTNGLVESFIDGMMAAATLTMMFVYSTKLTWIAITSVLLYALSRLALFRHNAQLKHESLVLDAKEKSNFMETIRAIQPIKLFGKEQQRKALWQNHYAGALNSRIILQRLQILYTAINQTVFPYAMVLIIWLGAQQILQGLFSVGMLYAFLAYQEQFKQRAAALIDKLLEFRLAGVDLGRVADIIETKPEDDLTLLDITLESLDGRIESKGLRFRYNDSDPLIFEDLYFRIEPGESVAIVGPSGCGKTTLVKVMLGLLKPQAGQILYSGIELSKLNKKELRQKIAAVMQDDQLLSGTIAQNITFFDPSPSMDRIRQCAKLAAIHSDIIAMPMGYGSLVGDMGTTLSGGQKQRILIARALYVEPRILFLDEASSHLDSATERSINNAIKELPITRITIAHRKETIAMADRVIDLGAMKGGITEAPGWGKAVQLSN
jgi:ATP-binding cassette subfamily B protein RaxB